MEKCVNINIDGFLLTWYALYMYMTFLMKIVETYLSNWIDK